MKVALIGFMGAGKTVIAEALAGELSLPVAEVDKWIVERSNRGSVREIFEHDGEHCFRDLETAVLAELEGISRVLISCGGGVVGRSENMTSLRRGGAVVVYLKAGFNEICRRLAGDDSRPLFRSSAAAAELYAEREPLYQQYADVEVETDGLNPQQATRKVLDLLRTGGTA